MIASLCLSAASRPAFWIGAADNDVLRLAHSRLERTLARWQTPLHTFATPVAAATAAALDPATPRLAILATDRPARWTLDDATQLSQAWPLMPIVAVASSLVDGRRRSGPPLPGIEDVAWYDLPGRVESWLIGWEAGRAGTLATPTATRRDERLLGIMPAGRIARSMALPQRSSG